MAKGDLYGNSQVSSLVRVGFALAKASQLSAVDRLVMPLRILPCARAHALITCLIFRPPDRKKFHCRHLHEALREVLRHSGTKLRKYKYRQKQHRLGVGFHFFLFWIAGERARTASQAALLCAPDFFFFSFLFGFSRHVYVNVSNMRARTQRFQLCHLWLQTRRRRQYCISVLLLQINVGVKAVNLRMVNEHNLSFCFLSFILWLPQPSIFPILRTLSTI